MIKSLAANDNQLYKILTSPTLRKVPEITIYFWIIKIFTTALGESTSDFLVHQIDPVLAVLLGALGFAVAMVFQFREKKYVPWIYWIAVTMVAVFGTMVADAIHIVLKIPYAISTVSFALLLVVIFVAWYKTENTLSIHSIFTPRREIFYWLTVIITFALGTATGDLTAYTLKLGFLSSGILFTFLFILPALAYLLFKLNSVVAFWFAYIMTRPLGASFADLFGKAKDAGGLGVGDGWVSLVLFILIAAFVSFLVFTRKDNQSQE